MTTFTGLSPSAVGFPTPFNFVSPCFWKSYNPRVHVHGFGLFRFRSPLLAESFLFLELLRCFSSLSSLLLRDSATARTGFPHSDTSGSCGCTRLAGAFRSVPRPSSALDAKASPVRPYLLLSVLCCHALVIRRCRYSRFSLLSRCAFRFIRLLSCAGRLSPPTSLQVNLDPFLSTNSRL